MKKWLQKVLLQSVQALGCVSGETTGVGEIAGVNGYGFDVRQVPLLVVTVRDEHDCNKLIPGMIRLAQLTFCRYRFKAYIHVVMTSLEVAYLW